MKKPLCVILTLAVIIIAFAGCQSKYPMPVLTTKNKENHGLVTEGMTGTSEKTEEKSNTESSSPVTSYQVSSEIHPLTEAPATSTAIITDPPVVTDKPAVTGQDKPENPHSDGPEYGKIAFLSKDCSLNGYSLKKGDSLVIIENGDDFSKVLFRGSEISVPASVITVKKSDDALSKEKKYGGVYYPGPGPLVAVDAGHEAKMIYEQEPVAPGSSETKYGVTAGTRGKFTKIEEYELNLVVSMYLRDELISRGYSVVMTREINEVTLSNIDRAKIANGYGCDINVKIHANGISNDSSVKGATTVCPTSKNKYIKDMYPDFRALAEIILDELCEATGFKKLRILEEDNMTGFNWADQPTTFVELGFMSNKEDDEEMAKDSYRRTAAKGIANGIDKYFESRTNEPSDEELVLIKDYIPDIFVDLKYSTEDNFTGKVIYDFSEPSLRCGTVKKLIEVQNELKEKGFSLKIWDAFRPVEAQFKLWEACPDPVFVTDPTKGYSNHSRGNTVDVTLVTLEGKEIEMPSGFDDFSGLADRDYSDVSETARQNALLLEETMASHGFSFYSGEWWHFTDQIQYPVVE